MDLNSKFETFLKKTKSSRANARVDILVAMKTLRLSEVSNTSKILWYLANHSIQNKVFYMLAKHLSRKNTMILSQNFKNTLFPNTPSPVHPRWYGDGQ
jgi:hypothetical protein